MFLKSASMIMATVFKVKRRLIAVILGRIWIAGSGGLIFNNHGKGINEICKPQCEVSNEVFIEHQWACEEALIATKPAYLSVEVAKKCVNYPRTSGTDSQQNGWMKQMKERTDR